MILVYHFPNNAIWYWRAGDTELHLSEHDEQEAMVSASPSSIIRYRLPADTREITSYQTVQTLSYRRASDTGKCPGFELRDLHLYQRMRLLCRRMRTSAPFLWFLFWRIEVCYRRLPFLRSSSLLRFRLPTGFFVIAPAFCCLSPKKQCRSQSSILRQPLYLGTLSPTLNVLHRSLRAFRSRIPATTHAPNPSELSSLHFQVRTYT